jgi:hypothetical protein
MTDYKREYVFCMKFCLQVENYKHGDIAKYWGYKNDTGSKRSWLRHYATSRKVAGLNPDEVIGFLN